VNGLARKDALREGTKSKYINKNNIPIAKEFFPSMSLETLDAGHWVRGMLIFKGKHQLNSFGVLVHAEKYVGLPQSPPVC